MSRLYTK